jgi:branched-chain amino acid transport system substrate-binding protein
MLKQLVIVAGIASLAAISTVSAGTIKIGFNAPLTGFAAADGNSALKGAQLAVEQVNSAGGINGDNYRVGRLRRSGKPQGSGSACGKNDHSR